MTNEYRVLIVHSDLQPFIEPWIQNLYLHGTNSLVISDSLNVYGSLYSDARSVTLNTNQVGVGASSLYGQLTWVNLQPLNANSGSGNQQFPNLLWLTNNGSIIQCSKPPISAMLIGPAICADAWLCLPFPPRERSQKLGRMPFLATK